MIISDTAVRQRVSVLVLAVIILIFGTYCYKVLPRESEPDITIPNVFVSTSYKGVASKDIETSITIEDGESTVHESDPPLTISTLRRALRRRCL